MIALFEDPSPSDNDSTLVDADTDIQAVTSWNDIMPTTDDGSVDYSAFSPN